MRDQSIFRLQGELEVLRARKAVVLEQQHSSDIATYPFKFKRLKQKLKLQKKKTNYLRIKLGKDLVFINNFVMMHIMAMQGMC